MSPPPETLALSRSMNIQPSSGQSLTRRLLQSLSLIAYLGLPVSLCGCGGPSVEGGTSGVLTCGMERMSDVQLTLYQSTGSGFEPIGFAQTGPEGAFQLFTPRATGPLWLPAGEYVCTLESSGAPVRFPREYASPGTTPLKVSWKAGTESLTLSGPVPRRL